MATIQTRLLTLKDVVGNVPERMSFSDDTTHHLAGRCLLDALEFLRIDPKWSARFGELMNAHAIRLCWQCVKELGHPDVTARVRNLIEMAYTYLLQSRKDVVPFYGDDLWDCAYVLDAMLTVSTDFASLERKETLSSDLRTFYEEVTVRLDDGLSLRVPGEWFGPALPTAAHRLLVRAKHLLEGEEGLEATLVRLKKLALTPIVNGRYLRRKVSPEYCHWHLGQVVAEFPNESRTQLRELRKLKEIGGLREKADQAYALARVIQGAVATGDGDLRRRALSMLYKCQGLSRPLGAGVVGDHVKASLNTLEGIWPSLKARDRKEVSRMLDAFLTALRGANRIGILVAIDRERDACVEQFRSDGATVRKRDNGDAVFDGVVELNHRDYQVVVITGKALLAATEAAGKLINVHRVASAILVGIAGSLGQEVAAGEFKGPKKGDVVIGTCAAAYRIREKVREEVADAPVPWSDSTWTVLPGDPGLFSLAHRVGQESSAITVHEGMIVTGNGVKDNPKEKKKVRKQWPGGLAVAEEGFALALGCMQYRVPHLEIRGISDLAEGDKATQQVDAKEEAHDQEIAANNAAKIALALVKALTKSW